MAGDGSILINLVPSLNSRKINILLEAFSGTAHLLKAGIGDLLRLPEIDKTDAQEILRVRDSGLLEKEIKLIRKYDIITVDIFDTLYPVLLKETPGCPIVLYIKGNVALLNEPAIAVVGTRKPTAYSKIIAEKFSGQLASLGITIVSGLALGIDTAAHKSAIRQGASIAVIGSGITNIYPWQNRGLAVKITQKGALVSEFPLHSNPSADNIRRRNRVISGLALGVLVVEARLDDGPLMIARIACEQNREVFAVPGIIGDGVNQGTNRLIKEGAKLVENVEDVLEELNVKVTV